MEKTENLEIKQPKTTKQKVIFGLKIAGNVLFYVVIIFLFLISIMQINSGGKNGIPNLFGKGYLSVQSDSMSGSVNGIGDEAVRNQYKNYELGQFTEGDLVIVDVLDKDDYDDLKVGDIITFWDETLPTPAYNTHRIVYLEKGANGEIINLSAQGDKSVQTSGIYKDPRIEENKASNFRLEQAGHIQTFSDANLSLIKAKVTDIWYGKGTVIDHIQDKWLWYFVLPVLLLLLFEVFMVVKNIMDLKGAKQKASLASDKDAMMAELAAEKERMRQELLAELASQKANEAPKAEEAPVVAEEVKEEVNEEAPAVVAEVKDEAPAEAKKVEEVEVKEEVVAEEVKTEE